MYYNVFLSTVMLNEVLCNNSYLNLSFSLFLYFISFTHNHTLTHTHTTPHNHRLATTHTPSHTHIQTYTHFLEPRPRAECQRLPLNPDACAFAIPVCCCQAKRTGSSSSRGRLKPRAHH